jgi:hypothetical protein
MLLVYVTCSERAPVADLWTEAATMDPITPPFPGAGRCDARKPSVTEILQRLAETQERLAASLTDFRPKADVSPKPNLRSKGEPESRRD